MTDRTDDGPSRLGNPGSISLEDHIHTRHKMLSGEVDVAMELINEALSVFLQPEAFGHPGWVYEIAEDTTPKSEKYSNSTEAMILWSLQLLTESPRSAVVAPVPIDEGLRLDDRLWRPISGEIGEDEGQAADHRRTRVAERVAAAAIRARDNTPPAPEGEPLTKSGSFGDNDPTTLAWLLQARLPSFAPDGDSEEDAQTRRGDWEEFQRGVRTVATREVARAATLLVSGAIDDLDDPDQKFALSRVVSDGQFRHAFWVLRYGQVASILTRLRRGSAGQPEPLGRKAQRFFANRFHQHMAAAGTHAFDPAEFAFALEGLVTWGGQPPDRRLLDKAFEIFEDAQSTAAYWRPTRPIARNPQGQVTFPLSVEVAQSLLRTCHWLDEHDPRTSRFADNIGLFWTYLEWLRSQVSVVDTRGWPSENQGVLRGWHSEYDPSRRAIHTWQTAQVIAFLIQYASQVRRLAARELLDHGGFKVSPPPRGARTSPDVAPTVEAEAGLRRWEKWTAANEPIRMDDEVGKGDDKADREPAPAASKDHEAGSTQSSAGQAGDGAGPYQVLARIREDFVKGEIAGKPTFRSFALYGPPGTGKTTQAQQLAQALRYPLIEVTTSDFVISGEGELEARAKAIFTALTEQSRAILFFDELDRLLLDRTAPAYQKQDTLFQFMTPGMLTKLQDLRDAGRCIFVLATNHHERIDSAIKRVGRIDRQYLLLPPNAAQRESLLTGFLKIVDREDGLKSAIAEIAIATPFFVWGELKQLARDALEAAPRDSEQGESEWQIRVAESLRATATQASPSLRLERYRNSFRDLVPDGAGGFNWTEEPWEEVLLLAYDLLESKKHTKRSDPFSSRYRADLDFLQHLKYKCKGFSDALRDDTVVRDARIRDGLADHFRRVREPPA